MCDRTHKLRMREDGKTDELEISWQLPGNWLKNVIETIN